MTREKLSQNLPFISLFLCLVQHPALASCDGCAHPSAPAHLNWLFESSISLVSHSHLKWFFLSYKIKLCSIYNTTILNKRKSAELKFSLSGKQESNWPHSFCIMGHTDRFKQLHSKHKLWFHVIKLSKNSIQRIFKRLVIYLH